MLCSDVAGESAHKIKLSSVPKLAHVHSGAGGGQNSAALALICCTHPILCTESPAASEHNTTQGWGFGNLGFGRGGASEISGLEGGGALEISAWVGSNLGLGWGF